VGQGWGKKQWLGHSSWSGILDKVWLRQLAVSIFPRPIGYQFHTVRCRLAAQKNHQDRYRHRVVSPVTTRKPLDLRCSKGSVQSKRFFRRSSVSLYAIKYRASKTATETMAAINAVPRGCMFCTLTSTPSFYSQMPVAISTIETRLGFALMSTKLMEGKHRSLPT